MKTFTPIKIKTTTSRGESVTSVAGITAEALIESKSGTTVDGQNISTIEHALGEIKVWWFFREQQDDLGHAAAVQNQSDADYIEIDMVTMKGSDSAYAVKTHLPL